MLDIGQVLEVSLGAHAGTENLELAVLGTDRVAILGTGLYAERIGTRRPSDCYFSLSMKYTRSFAVHDPTEMVECKGCEARETCPFSVVLSTPIVLDGETIGMAGVLGRDLEHHETITANMEHWQRYLRKLAYFYSRNSSMSSILRVRKLAEDQLARLFKLHSRQGIIIADSDMSIIRVNQTAVGMLGCREEEVAFDKPLANVFGEDTLRLRLPSVESKLNLKLKLSRNGRVLDLGIRDARDALLRHAYAIVLEDMRSGRAPKPYKEASVLNRIIGQSPAILKTKRAIETVARSSDMPVLILGETGSGKELVAEAIHSLSPRASGNMISLNCAALPESSIENELFGHERGAFTDSCPSGKKGKFEMADGGTLFLDEIGELSLSAQAKLLRAIEQRQFYRLGGQTPIRVNIRIIAATNAPLEQYVAERRFREDLYYRLNVFPICLQPLRARREDIPMLCAHFLSLYRLLQRDIPSEEFSPSVMDLFQHYSWPGNIRQLKNVVEYMAVMSTSPWIDEHCLPDFLIASGFVPAIQPVHESVPVRAAYRQATKDTPRSIPQTVFLNAPATTPLSKPTAEMVRAALERHGTTTTGKRRAAKTLGISLATLYRMLKNAP
jgi:transcriptional regulator with PAS, ATPase and Fis domain